MFHCHYVSSCLSGWAMNSLNAGSVCPPYHSYGPWQREVLTTVKLNYNILSEGHMDIFLIRP